LKNKVFIDLHIIKNKFNISRLISIIKRDINGGRFLRYIHFNLNMKRDFNDYDFVNLLNLPIIINCILDFGDVIKLHNTSIFKIFKPERNDGYSFIK
jgi:hypothetical protein